MDASVTSDGAAGTAGDAGRGDAGGGPDASERLDATSGRPDGGAPDATTGCPGDGPEVPVNNADPSAGPVNPIPSLWHPPASFHPLQGSYVYLNSDNGDYIGAGGSYTYTLADSLLRFTLNGRLLNVNVQGDQEWTGDFQAMNAADGLAVGYYPNLTRYPFNAFPEGGLDWYGEGRGCNTLSGWIAVDRVVHSCGAVSELELRFEQHCEGGGSALHGQIHYLAGDPTKPPGPVVPIPSSLWRPASGVTPASGSYLYMSSESGDFVGGGTTHTLSGSGLSVSGNGDYISLNYQDNSNEFWSADFKGMVGLTDLVVGYYPNLMRYPFHNPARGGLSVDGEGRGCNQLTGWFAIDSVSYVNGTFHAVDLRFEQHCDGDLAALHGALHYVAP
jgi:hypothetical protein